MMFRCWLLVLLLHCTAVACGRARAAEQAATADSGAAFRYRRVYAPADDIKDWPRGTTKYLPMESQEFDRLLKIIQRSPPDAQTQMAVRPAAARYQASLSEEQLIAGEAVLEITQAMKTAVLMPLIPCNLAVSKAFWGDAKSTPAALGLGSDGKLQVLVERSGSLHVAWSLAGRRDAAETTNFQFELPACPVNRFSLDLPAKRIPVVDHGIAIDSGLAGPGMRRWQIELGGHSRFRLQLAPTGTVERRPRVVLARQSTTYEFSLRGLEASIQLKLEAHNEPLSEIALTIDPPLQLVSALWGDSPVPWSVVSAAGSKTTRVILALPQPLRDGSGVLRLKAMAPLVTGQPWKLPRIQAERTFWQEGSSTLFVPAPLLIEQFQTIGCRQSGIGPLSAPRVGESIQFEYFGPDATVELTLVRRRATVQLVSGTSTSLGDGKMTSRVVTDFRTADASQFALEAEVAPPWTIDSAESLPAEALDDWSLDSRNNPRKLTVRLAKPLTPMRPIRLVIVARRLYASPGRSLGIDDVVPLRFLGSAEDKRLVSLRATGPHELKFTGDQRLNRINPQSLNAAELDLFAEPPGDMLFQDDSRAGGLEISLENRKPTYAAAIRVEASVGNGTLQESYVLACAPPKSARVDRLVVRFSRRRDAPLRWSLSGEDETALSARRDSPPQAGPASPTGDETWELTLRRPRSSPFEIRAVRESKLVKSQPVSLASLPDAASQQATVVVRSLGPNPLQIKNNRLRLLPTEPVPANQYQTARATYQYDPIRDAVEEPEPALILSASNSVSVPSAWVWNSELRSQYAADGTGHHFVTYRVQSAGGGRIHLTLPTDVARHDIHGVWVDDNRTTPCSCASEDEDTLAIELPVGEKVSIVAVHLTTQSGQFRAFGRIQPPLPAIDLPVLSQHWTVWLPPGYEACEYLPDRQASPLQQLSWSQRLLGYLGRTAGQPAFNPLRLEDWAAGLKVFFVEPPANDVAASDTGPGPAPSGPDAGRTAAASPIGPLTGLPGYGLEDVPGWTVYRLELPDLATPGLAFSHGPTVRMIGWLVFLLLVAAGLWKLGHRPVLLTALAGVLGVIALLIPAGCAAMMSTAMLAVLFCLCAGLLRRRHEAASPMPVPDEASDLPSTITGIVPFSVPILMAAVLLVSDPLHAAQPKQKETPQPPTYSVFVPVDEHQQPTGGKYYVPEALFDQLYHRAAVRAEKPQGWLIASATYRASLSKETASQRFVVDQLTAEFDIHVFGSVARVKIPFRHEEVKLLPGEALLDGRPIQPEWEANNDSLVIEIAEPGEYRLEVSLRPTMRTGNGSSGFDLAIPRLATSRLELGVPAGAPVVDIPSAAGSVRLEEQPSRWVADLGPTDQLSVRWQDATATGGAAGAIDVEELLWLRILPGSVLLDAKLKLKVVAGQLRRLQIVTDPGLQLLPLSGPDAPTVQTQNTSGQPQSLQLQWSRPISEATTVETRFLWTGVSSVGNLRLPQFEVLNARPIRRWLAVSVDSALEHHLPGSSRLEAVAVPEFTGSWGVTDNVAQFAFRLPSGPTDWNISTRPRRASTSVDQQTLALVFDGNSAEIQFDAQLTTVSGYVFQHRILAPASLRVDHVSLVAEGVQRVARWTRDKSGAVILFLTGPLSGRYDLSLRGSLQTPQKQKMPLPAIRIDGAQAQSSTIQLFRRPSVLLEIGNPVGLTEIKQPVVDPSKAESRRLVQAYRVEGAASPKAMLTVKPNRPQGRVEQFTRIAWEDGGWKALVDCHMHVTAGAIDEIGIDAPAAWNGPYKVSPGLMLKSPEATGTRHLVLQPRVAVSGDYQFTISGPLDLSPSDHLAVPEVILREIGPAKRFLILPKKALDQPIAWETQGLRETVLRDQPVGDQTTAYEVIGEPWQVILQSSEPIVREGARVRLADIRIAWQIDGSCRGTAVFDVETGKPADCPLFLPSGARLLYLAVAGMPVDGIPAGPGTWLLPLAADPQVQRVEVLFATEPPGENAADAGAANGQSPQPSPSADAEGAASTGPANTPSQAAPLTETVSEPFSLPWATHRRFNAPRLGGLTVERTVWTIAGPRAFGVGVPEDAELLDSDANNGRGGSPAIADTAAMWRSSLDDAQIIAHYAGRSSSIGLRYALGETDPIAGRLATVFAFGAIVGSTVFLLRRGLLWEYFARWPYAFGIALGLAWWLWLAPSVAGLAIVLAVLIRQLSPWPRSLGQ